MIAVLAAGAAACVPFPDALIRRAANELQCDAVRVNVIERGDIDYEVYDVEACGRRARYACVGGNRYEEYHCIREPDPPAWDPDPALAATIPGLPLSGEAALRPGRRRRICGPRDCDCALKREGAWYWRPCRAVSSSGYGAVRDAAAP